MADDKIKRREFIKLTGKASAMAAIFGTGGFLLSQNEYAVPDSPASIPDYDKSIAPDNKIPDLVSIKSGNYTEAIATGMGLIGGIERFISRGDVVTIKPNIGWDRTPDQGANTNPILVKAVAKQCFDAGASKVVISDVPCNDFRRTFRRSGIGELGDKIGVEIVFPEERRFVEIDLGGEILGKWPVLRPFLETDKIINMPVVKHHGLSRMTAGMKNWYGVLGGQRVKLQRSANLVDWEDWQTMTLGGTARSARGKGGCRFIVSC